MKASKWALVPKQLIWFVYHERFANIIILKGRLSLPTDKSRDLSVTLWRVTSTICHSFTHSWNIHDDPAFSLLFPQYVICSHTYICDMHENTSFFNLHATIGMCYHHENIPKEDSIFCGHNPVSRRQWGLVTFPHFILPKKISNKLIFSQEEGFFSPFIFITFLITYLPLIA